MKAPSPRHAHLPPPARGPAAAVFAGLVAACVRRFLAQNARPPLPEALLADFAARLWSVVNAAGLPPPLALAEPGAPGEMPPARVAELQTRVLAGLPYPERHADLDVALRQLLKACLQPEFRQCRESYKEVVDGACRRQELARTRGRISGAHCVDCPYWVELPPRRHAALLAADWVGGGAENFAAHAEVFLPEDYRELRVFLWQHARAG